MHAQEGYSTCLVCVCGGGGGGGGGVDGFVSVCYNSSAHSIRLNAQNKVSRGLA